MCLHKLITELILSNRQILPSGIHRLHQNENKKSMHKFYYKKLILNHFINYFRLIYL